MNFRAGSYQERGEPNSSRLPGSSILWILAIALSVAAVLAAYSTAGSASGQVVMAGEASPPARLSETGLYGADGQVDPRNRPFTPQYPLWTDGAAKARWIYLPEGTQIDVSDIDAWKFPAGTKLWKEFAWGGQRVETRMIWKPTDSTWVFATYVWNQEQTEALLAPQDGVPKMTEIAPGKRHSIPGVADCRNCHESSPAVVLGFTALQLSDDRDPHAPHREPARRDAVTLRTLVESNRLQPNRPDLVANPPRIQAASPNARAALGYLSANCGGCHNSTGPLARLGLNLLQEVEGQDYAPAPVLSVINSSGRYVVPGISPDSSRYVAPGQPDHSSILYRLNSRRPSSQMPPLGTVVVDSQAVELVRTWIVSLGSSPMHVSRPATR